MTKEKLIERIEEIERRRFYLSMADRWTAQDYATDRNLLNELRELNAQLATM